MQLNADYQAMQLQNEIFKYKTQARDLEKKLTDQDRELGQKMKDIIEKSESEAKEQHE